MASDLEERVAALEQLVQTSGPTIEEVTRLDIKPGDTVVLNVGEPLSMEMMESIRDEWTRAFPEAKAIVLEGNMEVTVLSDEQRDQMIQELRGDGNGVQSG